MGTRASPGYFSDCSGCMGAELGHLIITFQNTVILILIVLFLAGSLFMCITRISYVSNTLLLRTGRVLTVSIPNMPKSSKAWCYPEPLLLLG